MFLLDGAGRATAPPGSLECSVFVSPAGAGRQVSAFELSCPPGAVSAAVIPLPATAAQPAGAPGDAAAFMRRLHACFPSTTPIRKAHLSDDLPPEDEDDDDEQAAAAAAVAAAAAAAAQAPPAALEGAFSAVVVPAADLARVLGGAASPAAAAAAAFAAALPSGYSFLVIAFAAGAQHAAAKRLHAAVAVEHAQVPGGGLWLPLRSTAAGRVCSTPQATAALTSGDDAVPVAQHACHCTLFSAATARVEGSWASGGKTPEDAVAEIKHRHAIGTFRAMQLPTEAWAEVAASGDAPAGLRAALEAWAAHPSAAGTPQLGVVRFRKQAALPDADVVLPLAGSPAAAEVIAAAEA